MRYAFRNENMRVKKPVLWPVSIAFSIWNLWRDITNSSTSNSNCFKSISIGHKMKCLILKFMYSSLMQCIHWWKLKCIHWFYFSCLYFKLVSIFEVHFSGSHINSFVCVTNRSKRFEVQTNFVPISHVPRYKLLSSQM